MSLYASRSLIQGKGSVGVYDGPGRTPRFIQHVQRRLDLSHAKPDQLARQNAGESPCNSSGVATEACRLAGSSAG